MVFSPKRKALFRLSLVRDHSLRTTVPYEKQRKREKERLVK